MKDNKKHAVLVLGDMHTNSTVGLTPATRVTLDDGGTYEASKSQQWMFSQWLAYHEWAEALCKKHGVSKAGRVMVIGGEGTDGDHHSTSQIITRNPATQLRMACDLLEPIVKRWPHWYMVRGTEAHSGQSAWVDEAIADDLGAQGDPGIGTASWWHLPLKIGGVQFSFAHHINYGGRGWTKHTGVNSLAANIAMEYSDEPHLRPDWAVRHHVHRWSDSGTTYPTRAISVWGWQLPTAFVHKINRGAEPSTAVGGVLFIIENGEATLHTFSRSFPRRPYIEL